MFIGGDYEGHPSNTGRKNVSLNTPVTPKTTNATENNKRY